MVKTVKIIVGSNQATPSVNMFILNVCVLCYIVLSYNHNWLCINDTAWFALFVILPPVCQTQPLGIEKILGQIYIGRRIVVLSLLNSIQ